MELKLNDFEKSHSNIVESYFEKAQGKRASVGTITVKENGDKLQKTPTGWAYVGSVRDGNSDKKPDNLQEKNNLREKVDTFHVEHKDTPRDTHQDLEDHHTQLSAQDFERDVKDYHKVLANLHRKAKSKAKAGEIVSRDNFESSVDKIDKLIGDTGRIVSHRDVTYNPSYKRPGEKIYSYETQKIKNMFLIIGEPNSRWKNYYFQVQGLPNQPRKTYQCDSPQTAYTLFNRIHHKLVG